MRRVLHVLILLALTVPAYGSFLELPGERFLDTETGYTWYDIRNFGGGWWDQGFHTPNEVLRDIEGTGFHLATRAEVEQLFSHLPNSDEMRDLVAVIGWTAQLADPMTGTPYVYAGHGFFDDGANGVGEALYIYRDYGAAEKLTCSFDDWVYGQDVTLPYMGAWVVDTTPVPEPATVVLLGSGLVLLVRRGRGR